MFEAVENFKDCIGSQLGAVTHPDLQDWSAERAGQYAAWAVEQLRVMRGMEQAMELAAWWDSHPRNLLNSRV